MKQRQQTTDQNTTMKKRFKIINPSGESSPSMSLREARKIASHMSETTRIVDQFGTDYPIQEQPTIIYFADAKQYAVIATNVPTEILSELSASDGYPAYTPDGEYFIPKRFKVSFAACDGSYSHNVKTPQGAADKIREYIGNSDGDFGYVSDDGISRCTDVEVFHDKSKYGHRVPMDYLLRNYPAKTPA